MRPTRRGKGITRSERAAMVALLLFRQKVDYFALFRHPELFAGDALDRVRRLFDAVDLAAQPRVLGLQPSDVALQLGHPLARLLQLGDAAIGEEKRDAEDDGEDAADEQQRTEGHARVAD